MPYKDKQKYLETQASYRKERGPDYMRNVNLMRNYGITLEQYNEFLESQKGLCAICFKAPDPNGKFNQKILHVDHNHKTGKVRGLLCSNCNRMLGLMRENAEAIANAAAYIRGRG